MLITHEELLNINNEFLKEMKKIVQDIDSTLEAIYNLEKVQSHIKRFSINKPFLHLVNSDNQLSNILSITLPYYENDNVDIEIDPEINTDMISEDLSEKIKGLKNSLSEKFLSLGGVFKKLWLNFLELFRDIDKEMKDLKNAASSSKNKYSSDELKQISLNGIPEKDLHTQWSTLFGALLSAQDMYIKIGRRSGEQVYDFAVPRKDINVGLALIGKEIARDEKGRYEQKKISEGRIFKPIDSNAKDLGYSKDFFIKFCGSYEFFTKIQKMIKEMEAIIKDGRDVAIDILIDMRAYEDIRLLRNNINVVFRSYTDLIKEVIFYSKYVLSLGKKFNF